MRLYGFIACALALVCGGCASSTSLRAQSEKELAAAQQAYACGNVTAAAKAQKRAERLYEEAAARAYEEERPVPPPPPTPPPLSERVMF
jgi:hypothetical protein